MKKRVLAMLMATMMAVGMLAGCGGQSDSGEGSATSDNETAEESGSGEEAQDSKGNGDFLYKVGYSNLADSDENCNLSASTFKEVVESEAFAEAVGHKVSVEWTDSDNDITMQTSNVETLIAKGIDVLFLVGVDAAGNTTAVEACNKAGIPVFMVASTSEGGDWKMVGFNEFDCGKVQGEYVAENAKEGDKICYMTGTAGTENTVLREEGFLEGLSSRDDVEIISTQSGEYSAETAMQVTEDWVQAYGDEIDWIVTQDNQMAQGVIEVLKASNMIDKVRISSWIVPGTWDAEYIKNGESEHAVYVSFVTLGQTAAEVCEKFYKGEEIPDETYMELQSVTIDNYSDFFE